MISIMLRLMSNNYNYSTLYSKCRAKLFITMNLVKKIMIGRYFRKLKDNIFFGDFCKYSFYSLTD